MITGAAILAFAIIVRLQHKVAKIAAPLGVNAGTILRTVPDESMVTTVSHYCCCDYQALRCPTLLDQVKQTFIH